MGRWTLRGSWTIVASVLAVSTAALSSTTRVDRAVTLIPCINQGKPTNSLALVGKKDEYSPRFDGLKFIETLVTAHRKCQIKKPGDHCEEMNPQFSGLLKNTDDPWEKIEILQRY